MAEPLHRTLIPAEALPEADLLTLGMGKMGLGPNRVQREIATLLEAKADLVQGTPLHPMDAIEVTRRAGKTDGLFGLCVGRCSTLEDYQVTYCAQSGTKSRERFYAMLRALRRHGQGGWRPRESRGEERIEWDNGSIMRFLPPKASSFRGDAIDFLILDEAQEVDEEDAADLLGSVLPVFDTRPNAQLVIAGTAGATQTGLLWEALENGRRGNWGILEYAAPPGSDPNDEAIWLAHYPGPANSPTEEATLRLLRQRHASMDIEMFAREYLGIWPDQMVSSVFPSDLWHRLGRDERPAQPTRYGLAYDVTPDGDRTAVTATWRVEDETWGGVLKEDQGIDWAIDYTASLATKNRLPVFHDSTPQNLALAAAMKRKYPRVKTVALTTQEFASACASLSNEVLEGRFRHTRQEDLDNAVAVASKRSLTDGGWAWGRKASTASIAPLVSLSVGLTAYDRLPAVRITKVLSAKPV